MVKAGTCGEPHLVVVAIYEMRIKRYFLQINQLTPDVPIAIAVGAIPGFCTTYGYFLDICTCRDVPSPVLWVETFGCVAKVM